MGRDKNEADNKDYQDGYKAGREGQDPGSALADGLFRVGSDSYYAGKSDGIADRYEYGPKSNDD